MDDPDHDELTRQVVDRFADTPDPRLKEVMASLVRHLHAFAREVRLSEAEWREGIEFLTRVGRITSERRQEFILLSDTLGLSMLTVAMNSARRAGATESTVLGPFHVGGAPRRGQGDDIAAGAAGTPCEVRGAVRGVDGEPIAGARIEVWQADAEGKYDVQRPELAAHRARAVLETDADGRYGYRTVVPAAYPIPDDGPVGAMLRATRRHPWRPAHLHFMIAAPGYSTLVTHVFRAGDPYLDSDAVFGVRQSLIVEWKQRPDGSLLVEFDFALDREDAVAGRPERR